jgi:N-acetyl-alpha-D-muramate 1-phosphate uridylyltransferase
MRAMLLAAGRGQRMRPLTDNLPKPLLEVGGKTLIEHQLCKLVAAGFDEIIINHAYLGDKIVAKLGSGNKYGAKIKYSAETHILGTAGGIIQALPLLGAEPFLVVNSDIWTDFPFQRLKGQISKLAHIILVANPSHNPNGDFSLQNNLVQLSHNLTFSGIGVYDKNLFNLCPGENNLAKFLIAAIIQQQVTGEYYQGDWVDVGTPQRLAELDLQLGKI